MKHREAIIYIAIVLAIGERPTLAQLGTRQVGGVVSIVDGKWRIDGRNTYPGTPAEGLLMNVRMVNCTFEDSNPATRPSGFDPEPNTSAFIARIPDYVARG